MGNYFYEIGKIWRSLDSLKEARDYMNAVIKSDRNTQFLNRGNDGRYYIVRTHVRNKYNKKIIYL